VPDESALNNDYLEQIAQIQPDSSRVQAQSNDGTENSGSPYQHLQHQTRYAHNRESSKGE